MQTANLVIIIMIIIIIVIVNEGKWVLKVKVIS